MSGVFISPASATDATPGYPERVIRWKVEGGESCADIAETVYGSGKHLQLIRRYNQVPCTAGTPLSPGLVLIIPAEVSTLPAARITYVNPDTRAKNPGLDWRKAENGQALVQNSEVNTHTGGLASIQFSDSTKIFLDEHTLVVVYDSARSSSQLKTPPKVLLREGELRAGLAALRGSSVGVQLPEDSEVSASSSDTVIRTRDNKTNVSVFDGQAEVRSAGKRVTVPKNYGTKFVARKAPEKPRPLPPAPIWNGKFKRLAFAQDGKGTLNASWQPVSVAKEYRIEVSRTPEFDDLVVRQIVASDVTNLRISDFPVGEYFVRIRVIDNDDFLGISSKVERLVVLGWQWSKGGGNLQSKEIVSNHYSSLKILESPSVRVGTLKDELFELPLEISLSRAPLKEIFFSVEGDENAISVPIRYAAAELTGRLEPGKAGRLRIVGKLQLAHLDAIDQMGPLLKLKAGDSNEWRQAPLEISTDGSFDSETELTSQLSAVAEVYDSKGTLLGSLQYQPPPPVEAAPEYEVFPSWWVRGASARLSRGIFAPRAASQFVARGRVDSGQGAAVTQVDIRTTGSYERITLEADIDLVSLPEDARGEAGSFQFGLGYLTTDPSSLAFTPAFRVAVPIADSAPPTRFEALFATGSNQGRSTWIANAGIRLTLSSYDEHIATDTLAGFLLGSWSYSLTSILAFHTQLDGFVLSNSSGSGLVRGGLGVGVAVGRRWYVSPALRMTPWIDLGEGHLSGQLSIGYRGQVGAFQ